MSDEPEPQHRANRPAESDTQLVLRAIGWTTLWGTWAYATWGVLLHADTRDTRAMTIAVAAVALLLVARRRTR